MFNFNPKEPLSILSNSLLYQPTIKEEVTEAVVMQNQKVGTKVNLVGRIQSRTYKKEIGDGVYEERTAYEVSGQKLSIEEQENEDSSSELGA